MQGPRDHGDYVVYEGVSQTTRGKEASLGDALENLWENAKRAALENGEDPRDVRVRVLEIELLGSNPIDMFHVIGTRH